MVGSLSPARDDWWWERLSVLESVLGWKKGAQITQRARLERLCCGKVRGDLLSRRICTDANWLEAMAKFGGL